MNFRVAVVCFAILLPLSVWAGTCRNAQSTAIGGENLVVEVVGPNATIYPPLANGEPNKKSFSFTIDLTMVTERVRGPLNGDPQQSTNDICYTPLSSTGDPTLTPLSEFYRGKPCGELVKYVDLADYDCEADDYETFPAAGVVVKTVKLRMSHPDNPFVYIALFEVPNANLTKETYSDTTHTNGTIYSTYYRANVLKISWELSGWDWNTTFPTGTFVSTYTLLTLNVPKGYISSYDDGHWTSISWVSPDRKEGVTFELEGAYVIDGIPYVRKTDTDIIATDNVPFAEHTTLQMLTGTRICEENVNWYNLTIDPFVGIFSVDPSPPGSKGTRAYIIVLPVVFGIVLLLILALIIAVIVSPTVRVFFRPFSKKRGKAGNYGNIESSSANSRTTDGSGGSGWTKSSKPAH